MGALEYSPVRTWAGTGHSGPPSNSGMPPAQKAIRGGVGNVGSPKIGPTNFGGNQPGITGPPGVAAGLFIVARLGGGHCGLISSTQGGPGVLRGRNVLPQGKKLWVRFSVSYLWFYLEVVTEVFMGVSDRSPDPPCKLQKNGGWRQTVWGY